MKPSLGLLVASVLTFECSAEVVAGLGIGGGHAFADHTGVTDDLVIG
jgi:hypothetical protein